MRPTAVTVAPDQRLLRWAWVVFAIQGCFAAWTLSRGWSASLIDQHEYRQAQTALSVFWMLHSVWQLAYPLPLFGPPWSAPMEFPTYQALVAGWVSLTGCSIETAGRSIGVLMLALSLPAVWQLGRILDWSRPSRVLAAAAAMSAPVYLFYGRAILIETTALCAAAWFLVGLATILERPTLRAVLITGVVGVLAGLTKITTFAVFLIPAGLLFARNWRAGRLPLRSFLAGATPVGFALGAGFAWTTWSDHIKQSNPLTGFLVSSAMKEWNWGTLAQRLSGKFWLKFWQHTTEVVIATPALVAVVLLAIFAPAQVRRQVLALAASYLGGVLLFSNLYFIHDYYYCANAGILLVAAGLILGAAWESPSLPRFIKITATLILFGAQWAVYARSYGHHFKRASISPPAIANVIRAATGPEDVIVYFGAEWGALIPYYSQRRAIVLPGGPRERLAELDRVLATLPPRRVAAMYVRGPETIDDKEFLRERIAQFDLNSIPLAEGKEEVLYLQRDLLPAATAALQNQTPDGLAFHFKRGERNDSPLRADITRQEIDPAALSPLMPVPEEIRGQFLPVVTHHEELPILSIHAPADLRFRPPPGSSHIDVEVGMLPGAYAPGTQTTDGIEIVLYEVLPEGSVRELLRRPLRPAESAADRGTQLLQLQSPGGFRGEIVIAITPGPLDRMSQDWTYLRRIGFR
jgi:hypothetical protein